MMTNDPLDVDKTASKAQIEQETKDLPKRKDASGRMVSEKTANKPFFVQQDYKKKLDALEAEKAERRRVRKEKLARGEDPGPDPDAPRSMLFNNMFRAVVLLIVVTLYSGYFVVGDPLWGYENKWLTTRQWVSLLPDGNQKAYTEKQLARYDGTDAAKPVLLAFDGIVYDVSSSRRTYGPGGSYHMFAGKDAARAFVTGCFKEHLTHDLRGLDDAQKKSYLHWKNFYADHKAYRKVGTVYHKPMDANAPIPEMCDQSPPKQQEAKPAAEATPRKEL